MRVIHLIHGFSQEHENQQPAIAMLKPLIERAGYRVMVHDYGELHLLETSANDNLARLIYPSIRKGDTLVGFSNGASIIAQLHDLGVVTPSIVMLQPALRNNWVPNTGTYRCTVFYNEGDKATVAGKWWRRFTTLFPWNWRKPHYWGEMGNTGYKGDDPRMINIDTSEFGVRGHSDWINPDAAELRELIIRYI